VKTHILDASLVEPELKATTRSEALRELVSLVVSTGRIASDDQAALADEVVQREHLESAASGRGLSFQHAEISEAPSCMVVLGRSRVGIDMAAIDDRLVFVVLLMLSPPDKRPQYLEAFSDLVPLFHAEGLTERLTAAADPREMIEIIEECASSPA
jgi:mannitol/fructose-specific phosphotransferase system IIA component (Ntr-type)